VDSPVSVVDDGVKIKPEIMEREKLYHCIFKGKIILFFKDDQDVLNCFEIEDPEIIHKVQKNPNDTSLEKILEDYIKQENLKP